MLRAALAGLLLFGLAIAGTGWAIETWFQTGRWPVQPTPSDSPAPAASVTVTIDRGLALPAVARRLEAAGLLEYPRLWRFRVQLAQVAHAIKAGEYEIASDTPPVQLLARLVEGDVVVRRLTIVEGTTVNALLDALQRAPGLRQVLPETLAVGDLFSALELPPGYPEGWFFPDTYQYQAGDSDRALLLQAYRRMNEALDEAWRTRNDDLPYESPYDLLIMASIVEKESGRSEDRPLVAQVFVNRLRNGMRLQTDPTVIYGLGDRFDGNLTRKHLTSDTPYNTYTRHGLPPTPIALRGAMHWRRSQGP